MDKVSIQRLSELLGSGETTLRGDWVNFTCPFAPWDHEGGTDKNPSFGVLISEQESIYKCWSCDRSGSVLAMVTELATLQKNHPLPQVKYNFKQLYSLVDGDGTDAVYQYQPVEYQEYKPNSLYVFPEEWLSTFLKKYDHPYLISRGISPRVGKMFDVRVDLSLKRVCVPLRSFTGQLVGLQGRLYVEGKPRYKLYKHNGEYNPHIWGNAINCNVDNPVVLTEGFIDAMKIAEVYPNVMFSLTSSLSPRHLKLIQDTGDLITFYDFGTGGNKAREKLGKKFRNCYHITPSESEGDAGAMSIEMIAKKLKKFLG
ncbi:MAG: hypothetical protein GWN00_01255 [Aliifodinibius sp.]|nr:hypothetical protein [Fodinibius sp.]NIV09959.1 hypothetical protein [Fodinibius sp.]NIY23489.1 hypothetical protein [Fodinibius sp.]